MRWVALFSVLAVFGCRSPGDGALEKAQDRVENVEKKANAAAASAELTTKFRAGQSMCRASGGDCAGYDALKPALAGCQNKDPDACDELKAGLAKLQ